MAVESSKRKAAGKVVAKAGELFPGTTKKFRLRCRGRVVEGFLVSYDGAVVAFVNRCRHLPLSLDWVENHFFSRDGRYLICANHGAVYEPKSGECVWGPCYGAFLRRVPIALTDGEIRAFCPEPERDEP
jgi:nitrite reductase/ring-hydroxylating ferredoxin subunit